MGGEVEAGLLLHRLGMIVDKELGREVLGVGALGLEQRQIIGTYMQGIGKTITVAPKKFFR